MSVQTELETLEEYLDLLLTLDELMRRDPIYSQRCTPHCPVYVEKRWNMLQLNIMDIEEKISILKSK
jgi:hypothetical protein